MSKNNWRVNGLQKKPNGNGTEKTSATRRYTEAETARALSLLDVTNKKIISLIQNDVSISQSEIAKALGLSQSSIALRLEKLKRSGLLIEETGVEFKQLGLQLCRADLSTSDVPKLLSFAVSCPLLVNGTVGVGERNVTLYFVAEDLEMFQQILDVHIRRVAGVSEVQFSPVVAWARSLSVAVPFDVKKSEIPPCGVLPYCHACPANPSYDGKIWNGSQNGLTLQASDGVLP